MTQRLILTSALALTIAVFPAIAFAQPAADGGGIGETLANLIAFINSTLIPFILGIGFLFFVWNMFRYFIFGAANDDAREKGKNALIYTTVGFVAIIVFWGVINLLATSTGYSGQTLQNIPSVIVPAS